MTEKNRIRIENTGKSTIVYVILPPDGAEPVEQHISAGSSETIEFESSQTVAFVDLATVEAGRKNRGDMQQSASAYADQGPDESSGVTAGSRIDDGSAPLPESAAPPVGSVKTVGDLAESAPGEADLNPGHGQA